MAWTMRERLAGETSMEMQQWTNDFYYGHKDDYRQKCMDARYDH